MCSTTQKIKYYLGIDPGRSTGICIYDPKRQGSNKIVQVKLLDFWATIELIDNFKQYMAKPVEVHSTVIPFDYDDREIEFEVVIEDPQLNKPIFFPKNNTLPEGVRMDKAQKVGRNKENAYLLIEYMQRKKIKFRQVQPKSSKWSENDLRIYTKYTGSTNEHNRDAIRLVWGL
jgi:hypothetical protein